MGARIGTAWSPQDEFILRQLYRTTPNDELADLFGRQRKAIGLKARKMGLVKSEKVMKRSCFKAGSQPFNKGRPASEWNPNFKRCRATQFKPGHRGGRAAELHQPIGAERISKDGYLELKVNDDLPLQRRWEAVHRIVWREANGPIPHGHAVVFKAGKQTADKSLLTQDRLELVSRAELMRRNSRHNRYSPELNQLMQLKGALNRKINNRSRK